MALAPSLKQSIYMSTHTEPLMTSTVVMIEPSGGSVPTSSGGGAGEVLWTGRAVCTDKSDEKNQDE